jgi:hypothetical protein
MVKFIPLLCPIIAVIHCYVEEYVLGKLRRAILPSLFDFDVSFIDFPRVVGGIQMRPNAFIQFRGMRIHEE